MFRFIELIKRFLPPYKRYAFLSLLFNLLTTIFSLFSFMAIVPILNILFGIKKAENMTYIYWEWNDGIKQIFEAIKNNISYGIEHSIQQIGAVNALVYIAIFLVVMTFFKVGTAYLGAYFVIPIRTGVLRDLRNKLYDKILYLPIGFFTNERKGDIMTRMTSDVKEVENSVVSSLEMIMKNPIMIIIYFIVLIVMSWQLTLFVLILLPVGAGLIGKIGKSLKRRSTKGQEQTSELLSQIEETLGGLRIVKAFNAEETIYERFSSKNNQLRYTLYRIGRRFNLAHPVSEFLGTVIIAILLWFGGYLILNGSSSLGAAEFIYYLIIFYSIINPAKELSKASYSIQRGLASLERIDKILLAENNIKESKSPQKLPETIENISFKNISFKYETDWVLQDIDLTIPKGQTIAIVGQSGSGKSTLLDLLPRFYDVNKGEILLNNTNIKEIKTRELRSLMGNVNQEAILFNDTFYNNITFGTSNASQQQVEEAAKIANAHNFIMSTEDGYQTMIGDRGSKLSGGQRQRISIARAILKNPPILILDEATSALDTESEHMVQQALDNLMENRTTLVVAHRLSTIKKADLICVLHEGKIVERGKHNDLMELNGYYKKLVDMQSF